jgi:hypothetical protein
MNVGLLNDKKKQFKNTAVYDSSEDSAGIAYMKID